MRGKPVYVELAAGRVCVCVSIVCLVVRCSILVSRLFDFNRFRVNVASPSSQSFLVSRYLSLASCLSLCCLVSLAFAHSLDRVPVNAAPAQQRRTTAVVVVDNASPSVALWCDFVRGRFKRIVILTYLVLVLLLRCTDVGADLTLPRTRKNVIDTIPDFKR
jgi:hypothetical protein